QERLKQHLANLEKQVSIKEQQLALAQDIAVRTRKSFDDGVGTWMDASQKKLDADRLGGEVEQLRNDAADTRNALGRTAYEMASRRAAYAETQRGIGEDMTTYRARKGVLDHDQPREGNAIQIST